MGKSRERKGKRREMGNGKVKKYLIYIIIIICGVRSTIRSGDIWIDAHGTSSTSGTWNSGIRSDTEGDIYPPYVVRWEKGGWAGAGVNCVPVYNFAIIYNGYVYFGQGNHSRTDMSKWEEPGYVWAWDIATGVTKTGYPIGPLDSGIISVGGGIVIGRDKLYALTQHKLWGWDISGAVPVTITGFPVEITETAGSSITHLHTGLIYYREKLYFCSQWLPGTGNTENVRSYIYVKDGNTGAEVWRRQLPIHGGQTPAAWEGRIYVAERGGYGSNIKIHCFDAETGIDCPNYPIEIVGYEARAMPVIDGGKIYIGTQSGYFYRIDAMTGNIEWTYLTPYYGRDRDEIVSTASIWGDKVYFGGHSGYLYGLYKDRGEIVPGFPVESATIYYQGLPHEVSVAWDGPISTANGIVYTNNGFLTFAIDAETGGVLWYSPMVNIYEGGTYFIYNYESVNIGREEIVSVYPGANSIVVYEKASATATSTITMTHTNTPTLTITETITQTATKTATPSITSSRTESETETATLTRTATVTGSETATITATATETPGEFYLELIGNSPNPFEGETGIIYEIGREAEIRVVIWTISGEKIREIRGGGIKGRNRIEWDGKNRYGRRVSSGIYIYSIEAISGREREQRWGKCAVIR